MAHSGPMAVDTMQWFLQYKAQHFKVADISDFDEQHTDNFALAVPN